MIYIEFTICYGGFDMFNISSMIDNLLSNVNTCFLTSDKKTQINILNATEKAEVTLKKELNIDNNHYKLGVITFLKLVSKLTLEDRIAIVKQIIFIFGLGDLFNIPKTISPNNILEEMKASDPIGKEYVFGLPKAPKLNSTICNEKRSKR